MRAARFGFACGLLLACSADPEPAPARRWVPDPAPQPAPVPEPRVDFQCASARVLACTGLYGPEGLHWATKQLGEGVQAYAPGAELWSDGMHKARFVSLPPGRVIDASRVDHWQFPDGTRFWKEFSWQGKRVETRYLEKQNGFWFRTTYRWNADDSNAVELRSGELNVPGTNRDSYEIPAVTDCNRCHDGASDGVLGFDAILLSDSRATGLTAAELNRRQLIVPPLPSITVPGTDTERDALTYLHVNCGVSCHNPLYPAEAWWTGFYMRLEVRELAALGSTSTYRTGVNQASYIASPEDNRVGLALIAPGNPQASAIIVRDGDRGSVLQMPPLATHVVNDAGLELTRRWIANLK